MSSISFTDNKGVVYSMSATTKVSVSETASTTDSVVETRDTVTDNVVLQNRTISMDGVISNISSNRDNRIDTEQWIKQVRDYRKSKGLYTVQVHELDFIHNCVMTSMEISKTKKEGKSAWLCSLSFKEIMVSGRSEAVDIPEPMADVKDSVGSKKDNGDSSTKEVPEKLTTTFTLGGFNLIADLFDDKEPLAG